MVPISQFRRPFVLFYQSDRHCVPNLGRVVTLVDPGTVCVFSKGVVGDDIAFGLLWTLLIIMGATQGAVSIMNRTEEVASDVTRTVVKHQSALTAANIDHS